MAKSVLLLITSAVMVEGEMATANDLVEVTPAEAANFIRRGRATPAVPGVHYDPAEYPDAVNGDIPANDDEAADDLADFDVADADADVVNGCTPADDDDAE